ncbi:hypothetical protein niasHT_010839 [Heterodera trifolii]
MEILGHVLCGCFELVCCHIMPACVYLCKHIHVLVRACISSNHFELLYGTVYNQLQKDMLCRPIFFELLEVVEGLEQFKNSKN